MKIVRIQTVKDYIWAGISENCFSHVEQDF